MSGGYDGKLNWENRRATKRLNIGYKYNLKDISQSGYGDKRIAFDHLGRPYRGNNSGWGSAYDNLLKSECTITLCQNTCSGSSADEKISIKIFPETGFVCILDSSGKCI